MRCGFIRVHYVSIMLLHYGVTSTGGACRYSNMPKPVYFFPSFKPEWPQNQASLGLDRLDSGGWHTGSVGGEGRSGKYKQMWCHGPLPKTAAICIQVNTFFKNYTKGDIIFTNSFPRVDLRCLDNNQNHKPRHTRKKIFWCIRALVKLNLPQLNFSVCEEYEALYESHVPQKGSLQKTHCTKQEITHYISNKLYYMVIAKMNNNPWCTCEFKKSNFLADKVENSTSK